MNFYRGKADRFKSEVLPDIIDRSNQSSKEDTRQTEDKAHSLNLDIQAQSEVLPPASSNIKRLMTIENYLAKANMKKITKDDEEKIEILKQFQEAKVAKITLAKNMMSYAIMSLYLPNVEKFKISPLT
jgi:bacterioferritin (cytochrome b1)